jgi:hypothetical protein
MQTDSSSVLYFYKRALAAVVDALSQALQYSTLGLPRRCTNSLLLKKDETLRETQTRPMRNIRLELYRYRQPNAIC